MLSIQEANRIINNRLPDGDVINAVEHKNLFVFLVHTPDEDEGFYDPFYSVNRDTGEFSDYSIFVDGNPSEILSKFESA